MKNLITLMAVLALTTCLTATGQTSMQMEYWFVSPKQIRMPQNLAPVVSPITGSVATASGVANGMYDNAGNLLFYISDAGVYDYYNTYLGNIPTGGAEIAIVPFGNNNQCQRKFNIFSTTGGSNSINELWQTVLDMNTFSLSAPVSIAFISTGAYSSTEFAAIAVGPQTTVGLRYLYFMAGSGTASSTNPTFGQIKKLTVLNNGSVSTPSVLFPTTPYINDGAEIFAQELDLSPDGDYLAWASFAPVGGLYSPPRYHLLQLYPTTGDYVPGTYHQFDIPGANGNAVQGFRGVEFYKPQTGPLRLFMGAGSSGIFYTTVPNASTITYIFSSSTYNFGYSQLELSFNDNMYASSDPVNNSTFNIGAFDPSQLIPSIYIGVHPSFTLTIPGNLNYPPNSGWLGTPFYTLPDQIDGQDYTAITPVASAPTPTLNSYTQNASATWTYASGTNPWGATADPVQVIDKITVDGNSTLIISGMKIKFSPQAGFIIKKGSKVILDGTTLTSNYIDECNVAYTWKGVKVEGDINTSQNATNGQGKITLMNNSVIEYAECAIKNWDGTNSNTTGGIIVANPGTVFRDNKVDFEVMPCSITFNMKSPIP